MKPNFMALPFGLQQSSGLAKVERCFLIHSEPVGLCSPRIRVEALVQTVENRHNLDLHIVEASLSYGRFRVRLLQRLKKDE